MSLAPHITDFMGGVKMLHNILNLNPEASYHLDKQPFGRYPNTREIISRREFDIDERPNMFLETEYDIHLNWGNEHHVYELGCFAFDSAGTPVIIADFETPNNYQGFSASGYDPISKRPWGTESTKEKGGSAVITVNFNNLPSKITTLIFPVSILTGPSSFDESDARLMTVGMGVLSSTMGFKLKGGERSTVAFALHRSQRVKHWHVTYPNIHKDTIIPRGILPECQTYHVKFNNHWKVPGGFKTVPEVEEVEDYKITLVGATSVKAMDSNGKSDPYCIVHSRQYELHKTKIHKKTLDPVWGEHFEVDGGCKRLKLTVKDHDLFRDELIGIAFLGLPSDLALGASKTIQVPIWCEKKHTGTVNVIVERK